jgi:hypothetical protein
MCDRQKLPSTTSLPPFVHCMVASLFLLALRRTRLSPLGFYRRRLPCFLTIRTTDARNMTGSKAARKPAPKASGKEATKEAEATQPTGKKRGWDEIESLFTEKKKQKQEIAKKPPYRHHSKSAPAARSRKTGSKDDWMDDGLGGVHNAEGYTGRVEDGVKIFKAHVLSQPNAGYTESCPFDCKCCYI